MTLAGETQTQAGARGCVILAERIKVMESLMLDKNPLPLPPHPGAIPSHPQPPEHPALARLSPGIPYWAISLVPRRLRAADDLCSPGRHTLCSPKTSDPGCLPQISPTPSFGEKVLQWEGPRGPWQHLGCTTNCLSLAPSPDLVPGPADPAAREGLAAPPRRARARKVSCPLTRSNGDLVG